ncbi:hypothetical protein [Bacillus halotolerans]|uniref:hypothetical protein n=1 Tax=Bacillus halotolerans TaxID=260554 RepID=UPI00201B8B4F|nr:hypothetical protein [Bacillus halotolerans]MCM3352571.1 hypothetical protein [Bacillus halotolerans]
MEYTFEFRRDTLGYLRIVLPTELEYFSDFIQDIVSLDGAVEYLNIVQEVLDGSSEEYEIQLNTTIAYIKKDQTVVKHLYTESENDTSSMETTLCLFGETRSHKGIRAMIKTFNLRSLENLRDLFYFAKKSSLQQLANLINRLY